MSERQLLEAFLALHGIAWPVYALHYFIFLATKKETCPLNSEEQNEFDILSEWVERTVIVGVAYSATRLA